MPLFSRPRADDIQLRLHALVDIYGYGYSYSSTRDAAILFLHVATRRGG
jgi:hypothetical protein